MHYSLGPVGQSDTCPTGSQEFAGLMILSDFGFQYFVIFQLMKITSMCIEHRLYPLLYKGKRDLLGEGQGREDDIFYFFSFLRIALNMECG